ncbi:MAG TPA: PKD domain-containing protein [Thermoplasmata archaeon]|nr:PKD domain-containing protein [Thermoplasmata archaeon]
MGRRGAKVSLRQRVGLASAVWAVAFSLLAVVAATPKGPTAMLSVDDITPAVGQIVHFDASASIPHDQGNGRIVSYEFDFGDGNHTREQSSPFARHAYSLVGLRRATVQVEDARGNEDSASVRIDVQPESPPTGAPDLTPASASTIPAQPIEGQIAIVSIIIANHGNATAEGATIEVTDRRPNGTVVSIGTMSLPASLEPEVSVVVYSQTFVAMEVGNHSLQSVVGNVTPAETDVEDNTLTIRMTVLPVTGPPPGGAPDLAPESAVTIPTRPVEGESVSLSIKVVNGGSIAADAAIIEISDVRPNGTIVPIGTSVLSTPLEPGDSVVADSPSFVAVGVGDHQLQIEIRSVTPAETDTEDNTLAIGMTVVPAGPPPPPNEGGFSLDTALLAGGLAAAAVAAVLVATWLLLTPRETGPLEPPPPEPPDDSPPPIRPP